MGMEDASDRDNNLSFLREAGSDVAHGFLHLRETL